MLRRCVPAQFLRWGSATAAAAASGAAPLSLREQFERMVQEQQLQSQQREDLKYGTVERSPATATPISENPLACPRSALFVPCANAKALKKIGEILSDVFILDLEDSVALSNKSEAREQLLALVEEHKRPGGLWEKKRLVVRINSPQYDLANGFLDLETVGILGDRVEGVAIPKVTVDVHELIQEYVHPNHTLWAFFETPMAILNAERICASRRYRYAVMGNNDLAAELHLPLQPGGGLAVAPGHPMSRHPLQYAMSHVIMAARAYGMDVLDGVYNDPSDTQGFRREVGHCIEMGFNGKTLIHPSQVPVTNEMYTPTPEQVAWAAKVVDAVTAAQGGVAVVNGRMVEELHARQARRMMERHAFSVCATAPPMPAEAARPAADSQVPQSSEATKRDKKSPPSRQSR